MPGPRRALVGRPTADLDVRAARATPAGRTASRSPPTTSRSPSRSSRTPPTPGPARRVVGRGDRPRPSIAQTVVFTLPTPARRVPPGGDPADRPGAPAGRRPGRPAGRRPVRPPAGRVRAVRAGQPRRRHRRAHPGRDHARRPDAHVRALAAPRRTRWPRRPPSERPSRPVPYLAGIEFRFFDDPRGARRTRISAGELDAASGLPPARPASSRVEPAAAPLRYPGSTLTAVLLNLRPGHPDFADPAVRTALLAAIDRDALASDAVLDRPPASRPGPIPPSSPLFDPAGGNPPVPYDTAAAEGAEGGRLDAGGRRLAPAQGRRRRIDIELLSPDAGRRTRRPFAAAEAVAHDWKASGSAVDHVALAPGDSSTSRLATGDFSAAVGDMTIGLDPDLYPLLASSQTGTGGSNIIGLQDPALDKLLVAAREPGHRRPSARPPIRPSEAARARAATCSRWPSPTSPSWSATRSRERPSDRSRIRLTILGSILGCAKHGASPRPVSRSSPGPTPRWRNW